MSEQPTLPVPPGYCWRCGGSGGLPHRAMVAVGPRDYECVEWTAPCPECQPAPTGRDAWLEAVRLGRFEHGRG